MRMKKWIVGQKASICFIFIAFCLLFESVVGKSLEPILWSLQNKMFSESGAANGSGATTTIEVRIGEFLNILCPKYSLEESLSSIEFHALHRVSKQEFDECKIRNINSRHPILKCDRPLESIKYTLYIAKFSPVPDAIEFTPGNSYYFISTSNGSFSGINNDENGSCKSNNMKLIIKVLDPKEVGTKSTTRETRPRSKPLSNEIKTTITTTTSTRQSIMSDESNTARIPVINLSTHRKRPEYDTNDLRIDTPTLDDHEQQSTKTVNTNTNTNNDNIFILEPDSDSPIDYGDILSQIIFSSSHSPLFSTPTASLSTRNSDLTGEEAPRSSSSSSDEQIANFATPTCYYFLSVFSHVFLVFFMFIQYYY